MNAAVLRPRATSATWWGIALVITGFVVGMFASSVVLTLGSVVLSVAIVVPLAAALLWLLFVCGHGLADLERSRYRAFTGEDLTDPSPPVTAESVWRRFVARLRSPSRWRELLYLLLRLPVSSVLMTILLVVWAGAAALTALPLYVAALPAGRVSFGVADVGPGPVSWILGLVGLACLAYLGPWSTGLLTAADVAYARSLLAHGRRSAIEEQVINLESSRVAAVDSAEAERRRIERDLHDGAQQRLIAAAMDLGLARERLGPDPAAGEALVASAHEEVKAALRELRDLVRGIHPVILEDRGLDAALSAVVARLPVPVHLAVTAEPRPSPAVESAAYFIVSEALTNVTRHAGASQAWVTIERAGPVLRLAVVDDGRGGADAGRGTGLQGLHDRVAALGGTMALASPPGGPTRIEVELPCVS